MVVGNVMQHTLDSAPRSVALSVVAPPTGPIRRGRSYSVRESTAQRLLAVGVASLVVVRVEMGVRQVQHFQRRHVRPGAGYLIADEARLRYGRQCHLPVVVRVVRRAAHVADDEAADLVRREDEPRQDEHHLFCHGVDDALAHSPRLDLQAEAQLGGCVDDFIRRLAGVDVVLQQPDTFGQRSIQRTVKEIERSTNLLCMPSRTPMS